MSNAPRISVVIPSYNPGPRVGVALDTVAAQTSPASEVFVIDDGSTDGSRDIVAGHPLHPTLLQGQRGGPAKARNLGINAAAGDFVAFLDADDLWRRDHLEKSLQLFTGDVVAVLGGELYYHESDEKWKRFPDPMPAELPCCELPPDEFIRFFCRVPYFNQPSVVMRREAAGALFNEHLFTGEDVEFFARAIRGRQWAFNRERTVVRRVGNAASVTSENVCRFRLNLYRAMTHIRDLGYDTPEMHQLVSRHARSAMSFALESADPAIIRDAWSEVGADLRPRWRLIFGAGRRCPRLASRVLAQWRGRERRKHQGLGVDATPDSLYEQYGTTRPLNPN